MKNIIKKSLFIFLIINILISTTLICYATEVNFGSTKQGKQYKTRSISPKGFEDIILSFADPLYLSGENNQTTNEQKQFNNYFITGMCVVLSIYWIVLLFIFEKEDTIDYIYENTDDFKTLKKYNPLIAGCIVDNRQVLPRDIMAVVLNLIQKDYIKMEMIPNIKDNKENYIYMISENKQKKEGLDEIERFVLNWIFGIYEEEQVDLIKKLKELSKRKDFLKNFEKLNDIAEEELNSKGANIPRVPKGLRIFNVFLAIITILLSAIHIMNNGISINIYGSTIFLFFLIVACVFFIIPIVAFVIHLILMMIVLLKRFIKSSTQMYSGKKIVEMSTLTFVFMFIFIGIIFLVVPNKYICLDIFMIGIAVLIVKTDNLMTKHSIEILNDYYALNEIKYRIQEYSLIKDEQINYIKLWDEYLIYAVAFGIPIPIVNKLTTQYKEDEDLRYLLKCENLYYISKAYLEVMWEMEFKKTKKQSIFKLNELFNL